MNSSNLRLTDSTRSISRKIQKAKTLTTLTRSSTSSSAEGVPSQPQSPTPVVNKRLVNRASSVGCTATEATLVEQQAKMSKQLQQQRRRLESGKLHVSLIVIAFTVSSSSSLLFYLLF